MKRIDSIQILLLLAAFLLMVTVSGCVEPLVPDNPEKPGTRSLLLRIVLPEKASLVTKAEDVIGPENERMVHTIQIWAFRHQAVDATTYDGEKAVFYYPTAPSQASSPIEVTMPLPDDIMDNVDSDHPLLLDFYVLVNGSSVGVSDADSVLTRVQVKNKVMANADGSGFGSGTSLVTAVPDGTTDGKGQGLPMAGFFNNENKGFDVAFMHYGFTEAQVHAIDEEVEKTAGQAMFNEQGMKDVFGATSAQITFIDELGVTTWEDLLKVLCPEIDVTRAVSKVRFVFSKAANMDADTEITSIELVNEKTPKTETTAAEYENMLPTSAYLFPRENGNFALPGTSYESLSLTGTTSDDAYLDNNDIAKIDDTPLRLRKSSSMTLEAYNQLLDDEIDAGHATERLLYLRESDKSSIIARISYKIAGGTEQTVDIPLDTDFHRNRWWTVYTYFISYEIGFQVTVNPWSGVESHQELE